MWIIDDSSFVYRYYLNATETLGATGSFEISTELPQATRSHNIVVLNETHAVFVGGVNMYEVHLYNRNTDSWTLMPMLPEPQHYSYAGKAKLSADKREILIVAGGQYSKSSYYLELANPVNWTKGPDLPVDDYLEFGSSVPYGDTFLLVGGSGERRIFAFDVDNLTWMVLPQMLDQHRGFFAAFLIPDSFVTCTEA